jgi:hypothetical protein
VAWSLLSPRRCSWARSPTTRIRPPSLTHTLTARAQHCTLTQKQALLCLLCSAAFGLLLSLHSRTTWFSRVTILDSWRVDTHCRS